MRSVVVTGTSTGIGWGTAKVLIAHYFRVFGSVRKTSVAERLSAKFGDAFVPLLFDVTDERSVRRAKRIVVTGALAPQGARHRAKAAALADKNDAEYFGHLSAAEQQSIKAAMQDIVRRQGLKSVPLE